VPAKDAVRREFLQRRESLKAEFRSRSDRGIIRNLLSLKELHEARTALFYSPVRGEPDLTPLIKSFLKNRGEVVFPKVVGDQLIPYAVNSLNHLRRGRFGILEPVKGREIAPEDLDVALIPGITFDRRGYRIGFGKGYYDRLLSRIRGLKIGVAYSFQVLERVPRDPWDVPVDVIVTESEILRRS